MTIDPSPLPPPYPAPQSVAFPEYPDSSSRSTHDDGDDDHVPKRTRVSSSSWKSSFTPRQRIPSFTAPMPVPRSGSFGAGSSLKRKLEHYSSSMPEPVPEEEAMSTDDEDDDDSTETTESDESSSSSETMRSSTIVVDDAEGRSIASTLPLLHHDTDRLVAERLEEVKRFHEQDKEFFTREIRNLRMVLFDLDATLKDRTAELEFILKEREIERCEWEQARLESERRLEMEKEELRAKNRALQLELDLKAKDYADAMDVLEETQKELLGVAMEDLRRSRTVSGVSSKSGSRGNAGSASLKGSGESESDEERSALSPYSSIPRRIAALRKRLSEDEEKFRSAYNAWSNESKHLRKVHQKQLHTLNHDLRKSREEMQRLAEENKKLASRLDSTKYEVAVARRESQLAKSTARRSREIQIPASVSGSSTTQDKITAEDALKSVNKLNLRIAETASIIGKNLTTAQADVSKPAGSAAVREAMWLLGGEAVTSQLSFIAPPSKGEESALLSTLMQVVLTTWCGHHVHSWDLTPKTEWTSENPLVAVYRKLAIVEDPSVAATWRSLAKAQLKFSSTAWTQALISSLHNVFSFLGLSSTSSVTTMAKDLEPLLRSLRSVREAVGELVVSKELEVATVATGTRFDFRQMKDAFPNGIGSRQGSQQRSTTQRGRIEKVLATCGLGLKVIDGANGERLLALPHILREASFSDLLVSL